MSVEDPMRDTIKTSIKQYLVQFDTYAKAIEGLKIKCNIPKEQLERLPQKFQKVNAEKRQLVDEIMAEEAQFKNFAGQAQPNLKKLERIHEKIGNLQVKLLEKEDDLKKLRNEEETAKGCEETAPSLNECMSKEYKQVFEKLAQARKKFPDIYQEAESEVDIHFLTPFK
nr:hypothetical protein [Candidatus Sigynarchaeota archaeon]